MELNERLTDDELNRLIWGLKAHGNMKRTLAGLVELQERRAKDVEIGELLSVFQKLSAACDTGERRGNGSQSGLQCRIGMLWSMLGSCWLNILVRW